MEAEPSAKQKKGAKQAAASAASAASAAAAAGGKAGKGGAGPVEPARVSLLQSSSEEEEQKQQQLEDYLKGIRNFRSTQVRDVCLCVALLELGVVACAACLLPLCCPSLLLPSTAAAVRYVLACATALLPRAVSASPLLTVRCAAAQTIFEILESKHRSAAMAGKRRMHEDVIKKRDRDRKIAQAAVCHRLLPRTSVDPRLLAAICLLIFCASAFVSFVPLIRRTTRP